MDIVLPSIAFFLSHVGLFFVLFFNPVHVGGTIQIIFTITGVVFFIVGIILHIRVWVKVSLLNHNEFTHQESFKRQTTNSVLRALELKYARKTRTGGFGTKYTKDSPSSKTNDDDSPIKTDRNFDTPEHKRNSRFQSPLNGNVNGNGDPVIETGQFQNYKNQIFQSRSSPFGPERLSTSPRKIGNNTPITHNNVPPIISKIPNVATSSYAATHRPVNDRQFLRPPSKRWTDPGCGVSVSPSRPFSPISEDSPLNHKATDIPLLHVPTISQLQPQQPSVTADTSTDISVLSNPSNNNGPSHVRVSTVGNETNNDFVITVQPTTQSPPEPQHHDVDIPPPVMTRETPDQDTRTLVQSN